MVYYRSTMSLCYIICLLWLWALWQFVQLELSAAAWSLTFAWRREILTVKDKETEREAECTGGWAVRFWQPFIPLTHTIFFVFWPQYTSLPLLIKKCWWLSDCWSVFSSIFQLVCVLHYFSVSWPAYSKRRICVIPDCQLAYNTRMSANLSACSPLSLCASQHSQASLAVWAAFCHLAEGWSAGVIFWGHEEGCLSLGMHAGDSTNKTVAWRHRVIFFTNA